MVSYSCSSQAKLDGVNMASLSLIKPRETREGWPLLPVETEVNGDSKSTNESGPFLVDSLGLPCRYKRFFVLTWLF